MVLAWMLNLMAHADTLRVKRSLQEKGKFLVRLTNTFISKIAIIANSISREAGPCTFYVNDEKLNPAFNASIG